MERDMKPVIVGISGRSGEEPLSPDRMSGGRIARMMGLDRDRYLSEVLRTNLYRTPDRDDGEDCLAWTRRSVVVSGRRVVTLGRRVSSAAGIEGDWFRWQLMDGSVGASSPHPSGRSRWWNDPKNRSVAEAFYRRLSMPTVHVEGPDGGGKTTLVKSIMKMNLGFDLVPTDGPPADWPDCLRRIERRIAPGLLCDRSSGLISELVYGPVIRGSTVVDEETLWGTARSLSRCVSFIYCRPKVLSPRRRSGEDPTHCSAVEASLDRLRKRYDYVMETVQMLGCRVVRYDRDKMTVEEVVRCAVS